jgi:hypothetical protein
VDAVGARKALVRRNIALIGADCSQHQSAHCSPVWSGRPDIDNGKFLGFMTQLSMQGTQASRHLHSMVNPAADRAGARNG